MIYFDNGATTLFKPPEVRHAVWKAMDAGNPGRGGHRKAMEGAKILYDTRQTVGEHFGAEGPDHVCFFYNATTALNCVIKTLTGGKKGVLISNMEHNAVRRPALSVFERGVPLSVFNGYGTEEEVCASFAECLGEDIALAVFLHTSNICSTVLPIKRLTDLCKKRGVLSVIDCAQAGGHLPLSLRETGADGFVFPSHKGLMGIAGAGILIVSPALKTALENAPTVMEGGSGIHSFDRSMPQTLPERLEWGTVALPAVASVAGGIKFIEKVGYGELMHREKILYDRCLEGLCSIEGIRLHGMDFFSRFSSLSSSQKVCRGCASQGSIFKNPSLFSVGAGDSLPTGDVPSGHVTKFEHVGFSGSDAYFKKCDEFCMPILFTADGVDGALLTQVLSDDGICLREGFHCAPLAHTTIGTEKTGGIRVTFSPFNKPGEVDTFLDTLKREYKALKKRETSDKTK